MSAAQNDFRVTWEIGVSADNALDAARKALAIQRDPSSTAHIFNVRTVGSSEEAQFDLYETPKKCPHCGGEHLAFMGESLLRKSVSEQYRLHMWDCGGCGRTFWS